MSELEEIKGVMSLLRKYNLPISPILEYAIQEKIDSLSIDSESSEPASSSVADVETMTEGIIPLESHFASEISNEEISLHNCEKLIPYLRQLALSVIGSFPISRDNEVLSSFLNGETINALTEKNNISSERVRQILQRSISNLSHFRVETSEIVAEKNKELATLKMALGKQTEVIQELKSEINDKKKKLQNVPAEAYSAAIPDLDIPVRLKNAMRANHIETVYELSRLSIGEFLQLKKAGRKSLSDAQTLLAKYNLEFETDKQERGSVVRETKPIKESSKELKYYEELFANLPVGAGQDGKKLPHKAILLIAVMNLIDIETIIYNRILIDSTIAKEFTLTWHKYCKDTALRSQVWIPFWYMKSEPFWHFQANDDEDLLKALLTFGGHPTLGQMAHVIKYAYLDNSLFLYLKDKECRKKLKDILISTYIA